MKTDNRLWQLLLAVVLCGALTGTLAQTELVAEVPAQGAEPAAPDTLHPNPKFSPADVVRIQLEALRHNDVPHRNAGIELAFRFASPANKSTSGPLERFIAMVNNPVYRPMLNHRKVHYGAVEIESNAAVQAVILVGHSGERVGYLFSLSKQKSGRYASCWMTEAVIRFEIESGKPVRL
ncbi:MAG: DUF4864 domain-containing protein [Acidiferrobacterales bacterium]